MHGRLHPADHLSKDVNGVGRLHVQRRKAGNQDRNIVEGGKQTDESSQQAHADKQSAKELGQGVSAVETARCLVQFIFQGNLFLVGNGASRGGGHHAEYVGDVCIAIERKLLKRLFVRAVFLGLDKLRQLPALVHQLVDTEQNQRSARQNDRKNQIVDLRVRIAGDGFDNWCAIDHRAQNKQDKGECGVEVVNSQAFVHDLFRLKTTI